MIKPISSESAAGGVGPEAVRPSEKEEKPKYLRVKAPELIQALKPVLSEVLAGETQSGGDGDLSKEEKLTLVLKSLMGSNAGLENLQFLIQQSVNGEEVNSKSIVDFVEVAEEDRKAHTDPIFKLKSIRDDQFIYRSGEFEVDALGFFQGLFDILAMADCITEEERDLLIARVVRKLSNEKLRFGFQEQDWVTQGGPGITEMRVPHVIPEEEMPGAPKWQRTQSVFKKYLITPKLLKVGLKKPGKEEKLGSVDEKLTEVV